jgi:hypothetical protein
MQLVPEGARSKEIPCRYIPLSERGETVDSFYRTGTQEELDIAVAQWLRTTIDRLQREKAEGLRGSGHPEVHVRVRFTTGR